MDSAKVNELVRTVCARAKMYGDFVRKFDYMLLVLYLSGVG